MRSSCRPWFYCPSRLFSHPYVWALLLTTSLRQHLPGFCKSSPVLFRVKWSFNLSSLMRKLQILWVNTFFLPFHDCCYKFFRNPQLLHRPVLPHCLHPGKLFPLVALLGASGALISCRCRPPSSVPPPAWIKGYIYRHNYSAKFYWATALLGKISGWQKKKKTKRKSGLQN